MDFTGKRVLITGGSRGIGSATALQFAERGARVAINFRSNMEAAQKTLDKLQGEGHLLVKADISDAKALQTMVEDVIKAFDGIDILVNNAAVYIDHPITNCSFDEWQAAWQDTLSINLTGTANLSYLVAQQMIHQGGGRIVNISSRGAYRGEPNHPAYAASKAGLNALSQSLAQALGAHGIFVGAVAPGFVKTEMAKAILEGPLGNEIRQQSPLGRVAEPEEVAWSILFLASEQARFNTGAILDINGASYLR